MTGNTSGLTLHLPEHSLCFSDSNGISFGSSVNGYSTTITASMSSVEAGNNLSLSGNTAGTLTLMNSGTVTIIGGNNITLSQDGNAFSIIGAAAGTGGAGTGFSSVSTTGSDIVGSLASDGLNLGVPQYLTTAMQSNAGSNFIGLNTSIEGANMTANSSGITLSIPMATATAANAVIAGNNISISTFGGNTTVSAVNVMDISERNNYFYSSANTFANSTHTHGLYVQSVSYSSGTDFMFSSASNTLIVSVPRMISIMLGGNTSGTTALLSTGVINLIGGNNITLNQLGQYLYIHGEEGNSSPGIAFQDGVNSITNGTAYLSDVNGISFGIAGSTITGSHNAYSASSQLSATFAHTSHTHSNLYIPLSASTAYQTSVLDNTFAITNHTHTEGNVYFVNSLGSNLTWGSSTSGGSTSIFATAGGGTGAGTGGVAIRGSGTYIHSTGTVQFSNSNGLSFGLSGGTMTASLSQASLALSDSNGVSFGLYSSNASGSTVTATVRTNYASSNHTHGNVSLRLSNLSGTYSSASNGLTISLTGNTGGAVAGIAGMGNTATIPFTSGSVRISGVNLTINTSSAGASQYLQISAPALGYLFFSNTNGHSWGSSINGLSTYIYIITA
jgi:hypothetical protein